MALGPTIIITPIKIPKITNPNLVQGNTLKRVEDTFTTGLRIENHLVLITAKYLKILPTMGAI